jgi:hypothetical protein
LHEALSMQGNGDDRVEHGSRKMLADVRHGQVEQRWCEVQLAAVLELMNRLP